MLIKRLQDRHVECVQPVDKRVASNDTSVATVSPGTPNVLQTMMHLQQDKTRGEVANKVALETEKEKDDTDKSVTVNG